MSSGTPRRRAEQSGTRGWCFSVVLHTPRVREWSVLGATGHDRARPSKTRSLSSNVAGIPGGTRCGRGRSVPIASEASVAHVLADVSVHSAQSMALSGTIPSQEPNRQPTPHLGGGIVRVVRRQPVISSFSFSTFHPTSLQVHLPRNRERAVLGWPVGGGRFCRAGGFFAGWGRALRVAKRLPAGTLTVLSVVGSVEVEF